MFQHEFPNFQVDVYVMVLDNAGSSLAAAIMAASTALANAGVPMFGLVTASTIVSDVIKKTKITNILFHYFVNI